MSHCLNVVMHVEAWIRIIGHSKKKLFFFILRLEKYGNFYFNFQGIQRSIFIGHQNVPKNANFQKKVGNVFNFPNRLGKQKNQVLKIPGTIRKNAVFRAAEGLVT